MELRDKTRPADPATPETAPSVADTRQGEERLQQASQRLTAARAVVSRALSNSPDTFLRQAQQRGGQ